MTTAPSTEPWSVSLKRKGPECAIGGAGLGDDTTDRADPKEPLQKRGKTVADPATSDIADTADIEDGPADSDPSSATLIPTALATDPAKAGNLAPNAPNVFGATPWARRSTSTSAVPSHLAGRSPYTFASKSKGPIVYPSPGAADISFCERAARPLAAMSSERFSSTTDVACRSPFSFASRGTSDSTASMNPFPDAPDLFAVGERDEGDEEGADTEGIQGEEEEEEGSVEGSADEDAWLTMAPPAEKFETSKTAFKFPKTFASQKWLAKHLEILIALGLRKQLPDHGEATSRRDRSPRGVAIFGSRGFGRGSADPSRTSVTATAEGRPGHLSPVIPELNTKTPRPISTLVKKAKRNWSYEPLDPNKDCNGFFDAGMDTLRVRHAAAIAQQHGWPNVTIEWVRKGFKEAVLESADNKVLPHSRHGSWRRTELFYRDLEYHDCLHRHVLDIQRLSSRFKQEFPGTATQDWSSTRSAEALGGELLLGSDTGFSFQWIMLACGHHDLSNQYQDVIQIELVATLRPQHKYLTFGLAKLVEVGAHLARTAPKQYQSRVLDGPLWKAFMVCLALLAKRLSTCDSRHVTQGFSREPFSWSFDGLKDIREALPADKTGPLLEVSKLLAAYK